MHEPSPPTPTPPSDLIRRQQARVNDYLATALEDPDPLRANAAVVSSGLMGLARQLKCALDDAMGAGLDPFDDFEELSPALNAYLRMTRQIQSFAHLDRQLANGGDRPPRGG